MKCLVSLSGYFTTRESTLLTIRKGNWVSSSENLGAVKLKLSCFCRGPNPDWAALRPIASSILGVAKLYIAVE
jgi:hypothetical protein